MVQIQTHPKKFTFAEYLNYEDETDYRYELIDGELVPLAPESEFNNFIANFLLFTLASSGIVPLRLIRTHACEVQVPVLQPKDAANRYPDVVVLREEHLTLMNKRLTITLDMPPPRLVAEVVSPGKVGRERDYNRKRKQYAAIGIPEYWIIDPAGQQVMVLRWESGEYVESVFAGSERIISAIFPELELTVEEIFQGQM
ncbi:MAG TPA: Uma2 family endonuclease [Cyanobacteria bacterium UBA11149]|nr:Uma2 family endonuclease [Cyanobacteria bacterium UBA11367]HBE58926.1 Uma2 family endonuclease [Cyanobacteria bacterium UBA11366]HBR74103.1 Uma2 family endonuclease [Cyanobacteria bacterium UBA11159]HBS70074.1 Uma2 family endonuclease [Cyanobacteria bacterium UBA11153]HBW87712.1 Uma2 family endonuclease [Cyanobacteria bacterium UBA11149]HCA94478.1 Uma2 family endonuclease [Cyanobacteria bacterium UBA9226]